ncbi:MAG: hydrogenase maturation protease [Acidobacteria bacterium]|nr:hydrogenase maturation protease [Acidobacteriota bacterium]
MIVGLGNPVLADDSVGLHVAAELRRRLAGRNGFTTLELYSGGLLLMEAMAGHDRAIVIDAMVGGGPAGAIHRLGPEDLPRTRTTNSTHDSSLPVALELGRAAGLRLPADIRIWAIEAADVETFSQRLTPQVALASRRVVGEVMRELAEPPRTSP